MKNIKKQIMGLALVLSLGVSVSVLSSDKKNKLDSKVSNTLKTVIGVGTFATIASVIGWSWSNGWNVRKTLKPVFKAGVSTSLMTVGLSSVFLAGYNLFSKFFKKSMTTVNDVVDKKINKFKKMKEDIVSHAKNTEKQFKILVQQIKHPFTSRNAIIKKIETRDLENNYLNRSITEHYNGFGIIGKDDESVNKTYYPNSFFETTASAGIYNSNSNESNNNIVSMTGSMHEYENIELVKKK